MPAFIALLTAPTPGSVELTDAPSDDPIAALAVEAFGEALIDEQRTRLGTLFAALTARSHDALMDDPTVFDFANIPPRR